MKTRIKLARLLLVVLLILFNFSCKGGSKGGASSGLSEGQDVRLTQKQPGKNNKVETEKKLYHCPMHPNYTSDKPGSCPICGMDLVPVEKEEKATPAGPKKKTMYRSTMNPNEISDKPGKDSMGMEMVPFESEESAETRTVSGRIAVKISPERQQLIGVKTETLRIQPVRRLIKAVGRVDYAEPNISFVTLKLEGWVDRLYVSSTGQLVKKGEPLLDIYSPELIAAQQEYLLAVKAKGLTGDKNLSLLKSARERLRLWDISDQQVEELERMGETKKTLTLYAPVSGFVIEKNVFSGQRVMAGENLFKIADLSRVWVIGEVYEYELPFVKQGQEAGISLSYFPGETFSGKITYIYPYLNPETRTNRVRIEVNNPGFKLKPEMYANLEIRADYGSRLAIPEDAVIDAGEKKIAFIDKGDGYLEPREVRLGVKGDGIYEVLEGVAEGEKVVTSANFLIDSESSLKAALKQMTQGTSGERTGEHRHD